MNIKYCGALRDYSGYGEAGRHDVGALLSAGVEVKTEMPSYVLEVSDFGELGEECRKRQDLSISYGIKILHTTPNVYSKYYEEGKYHIGRVIWETDKLPKDFADNVQKYCDEIWTASEFNKKAIEKAGVTKPIYVIPEAIDCRINSDEIEPYLVSNNQDFKFYSMFEWTERKNPSALLEAFWTEFDPAEPVSLTIKTYVDSFRPEKQREIDDYVKAIKRKLNLSKYAPLYLYKELMDRHQIYRFHKTFDVYVSTHRGEGWGIPQTEAMLMGKPIISTNCGGCHEYLTQNVDSLLLEPKMIPVRANSRNQIWYTQDQNWADVDIDEVKKKMRYMFESREIVSQMGKEAKKTVKREFDLPVVGDIMKSRLEIIQKQL
ncbi:glycosyltransferase [Patescibacteria group bacterium]|nr:glycosyltransferase [Patescibacteria group bacterium]